MTLIEEIITLEDILTMATKQNSNRPYKGLYKDSSPIDQPKGTYTMAWNAVNETIEGDNNFISNEQSNALCGQLPSGYKPIGDVYIGDNSTFVFSTNGTNSEMGIIDGKCTYTSIVNNTCLGFNIENQIDAIFRVRKGCERTVYFTDGLNPVRYFNIDKPEDFKDGAGAWNCELFKLFLDFTAPCFSSFEVNELGFLESGTYAFALQFLDDDNNPTKWSYISQPVPIFKSQINSGYYNITGSSNLESDSQGGTSITNKGIEVTLTNLDQDYAFYRFAVIHYTNFSGLPTIVYQSGIKSTEINNFFYGGPTDEFTQIDLAEITISPDFIETADHIEQLENRLLLANTKGKKLDFCSFQDKASKITSKYVVVPASAEEIITGNSKDPDTYWHTRGYMGDEVYAFGIVYVFNDGYESPVYHIPGTNGLFEDCNNPCVSNNYTQHCLVIREATPDTSNCVGTGVTSYVVNYTLNGVNYSYSKTINNSNDINTFNEIVCSEYPIENLTITVENNNCTAFITELPLYDFAFPSGVLPAEINNTWWEMKDKVNNFQAWGFLGPIYAREKVTTTCVSGSPVPPSGTGWVLLSNDCSTAGTATYVRQSAKFMQGSEGILSANVQSVTSCTGCTPPCSVPYPSNGNTQSANSPQSGDWVEILFGTCTTAGSTGQGQIKYWLRSDSLYNNTSVYMTIKQINKICPQDIISVWNQDLYYLYPNETAYNSLPNNEKLKYWQVYNTAAPINETSGYMSYWESPNSVYPTILDCNGNDYWGTDNCGNTLAGTPIRHHKFPDRNLIPHIVTNNIQNSYTSYLDVNLDFNCATCNPKSLNNIFTPTNPLELIINYDFEGIPQTPITINISESDFIYDSSTTSYNILNVFITRMSGQDSRGITNVVASGSLLTTTSGSAQIITVDIDGNPVSPSADISESSPISDKEINVLGIKFDNITYPHSDIVGHYIVRGDRDIFNRTVIDKGISNPLHATNQQTTAFSLFSFLRGGPDDSGILTNKRSASDNYLLTPDLLFNKTNISGTHIKRINEFRSINTRTFGNKSNIVGQDIEFDNFTQFGAPAGTSAVLGTGTAVLQAVRILNYEGLESNLPIRIRPINKSLYMSPLSKDENFINGRTTYNISQTNSVQILDLVDTGTTIQPENNVNNLCYVSVKADRNIHPDLFSIKYYRTHNCLYNNSVPINIFGGDTFINRFDIPNTIFYRTNNAVWGDIFLIVGIIAAAALTAVTLGAASPIAIGVIIAGAVGVTSQTISTIIEDMQDTGLEDALKEDTNIDRKTDTGKQALIYTSELASGIYVESTININLRQDLVTFSPGNTYLKPSLFVEDPPIDELTHFRDKLVFYNEDAEAPKERWLHRGITLPEIYHYNKDFSVFNKLNVYFPLFESYDCCSNCLEEFPTRISYSQQSFQEEAADNYRVFLANNYRDIEAEKGDITNLIRNKNSLLVHTKESLFALPQNVQERITNDLISFIGTGDYFSIPPRLIVDDALGSAGSIDKWATTKTENGIFFVDQFNGQIFLTGAKGLVPINTGLRNYFKENLVLFLAEQYYNLTSTQFPNKDNHANPNGIGFHSVYDYRHKRIILTKRDYQILPAYTADFKKISSVSEIETGKLFFNTTTNKFGIGTGVGTFDDVDLSNATYFENKSWTLSYSFLSQSWISFHSYIPLYMYSRHNNFVSFIDNRIWKHGIVGNYQNFYGTRYKHILEYISLSSPIVTRIFDEVLLQTIAKKYDTGTKEFIDQRFVTFNKAIFHNSTQATGELTLNVKNYNTEDYLINQINNGSGDQITIDRNERNWTINEIRDYRTDYLNSIWTKNWTQMQIQFPIDKVINSSTISFTKDWYDLQPMRDKYLIIRFIFDNFDDISLTTNYTFEKENRSFR